MVADSASRRTFILVGLTGLLGVALVAALAFGAVPVAPGQILGALARGATCAASGDDAIILDVRLPRVILAALVGACLAVAGALYQALFRNPLADPYILGVSSGAGLAATIATVASVTLGAAAGALALFTVPIAAFIGAIATIALVVGLASRAGRTDGTSLLLAGVAISYTLAAATSFLLVVFRANTQTVIYWMMGGLTAAGWTYVWAIAPMFLIGAIVPLALAPRLDIILLGDERAGHLGIEVERFKRLVLGAAALLTAAAVSVSGLIGFVGLMTPHMVRLAFGPRHRLLIPASALAGATLLVVADTIARTAFAPIELPVGIVTALFGGPFFVWLLVRGAR